MRAEREQSRVKHRAVKQSESSARVKGDETQQKEATAKVIQIRRSEAKSEAKREDKK